MKAFDTNIAESAGSIAGPWRRPRQMLHAQVYDSHASIHDDATAQKLGFQGMLLNLASIKDSYSPYQKEHSELYA